MQPDCHRPNATAKEGWKALVKDFGKVDAYEDGINWIHDILEKDCFPKEALDEVEKNESWWTSMVNLGYNTTHDYYGS